MNNEMSVTADLLQIKTIVREFQQISYSLKQFENKFPDIEYSSNADMLQYMKIALAFTQQISQTLNKFQPFVEKYAK